MQEITSKVKALNVCDDAKKEESGAPSTENAAQEEHLSKDSKVPQALVADNEDEGSKLSEE